MTRKRTMRSMCQAGLGIFMIGTVLAITGVTAAPAGAEKPDTFKITLCHRTNAPTNPYRIIEVAVDASNGELVGPDHTGHEGPAFDFTADPSDLDYPYTTPRNGDQWGDIIPPYEFDGGSFPGMNWEDGEAIHDAGCQGPEEEPDPTCPQGQAWDDDNDNGILEEGECVTPVPCPEGTDWVDANENGIEETGECAAPNVFACPTGTSGTDTNGNTEVDPGECAAPAVDTPETEVAPNVITRPDTLPRTGKATAPLTIAGLGLIVLGLGALRASRRSTATI